MDIIDYENDPVGYLEYLIKDMIIIEKQNLKPLWKAEQSTINYKNKKNKKNVHTELKMTEGASMYLTYNRGRIDALQFALGCLTEIPKKSRAIIKNKLTR